MPMNVAPAAPAGPIAVQLPDNPIKQSMRRNAYAAGAVLAKYTGDTQQPVLMHIAEDYTERVAARTGNVPPFLNFEQIVRDPNFVAVFRQYNVKKDEAGDLVSAKRGFALNGELIGGVPNGFLYSTLAGVAYFGWKYYKKKRGG